jgi:hypothetical protein
MLVEEYMGEIIGATQKQYSCLEKGDSSLTIDYLEITCNFIKQYKCNQNAIS